MEDNTMNNDYTATEVIEIGKAQEVILGEKVAGQIDQQGTQRLELPGSDLDD